VYITEKSHTKYLMYCLDRGCVRTSHHLYGYTTGPQHGKMQPDQYCLPHIEE